LHLSAPFELDLALAFWQKDVTGSFPNPDKVRFTGWRAGANARRTRLKFPGVTTTHPDFRLRALHLPLFCPGVPADAEIDCVHALLTVFALGAPLRPSRGAKPGAVDFIMG
jgi:hypothetical protein